MDSDALDTCLFCTSVHFSVEIGFCDGKDAVGWLHGVQAFDVILHFIAQKRWHLNHAVALGCLGVCNHVTAFDSLIGAQAEERKINYIFDSIVDVYDAVTEIIESI